jgi:putative CocE/NonD family hydrolase
MPACASTSAAAAKAKGCLHDEYSEVEQQDGCDLIAWIAAQDWCDGQVATIGISWGGFNGLQIAARQPPALKTVIAVGFTDDRYATDVHYIGGCLSKDNIDWSGTMVAGMDLPPDPALHGAALARPLAATDRGEPALGPDLDAPPAPG